MAREQLTVLIPTFNSDQPLADLLRDVSWADEILVVDSYSADNTVAVARQHGARVIEHAYVNSANQKNWAIPQCLYDWVLVVDTDERLPLALQTEILRLLASGIPADVEAYCLARQTIFLGQWLKSMALWPDYQTRLFRKTAGRYEDLAVHADVVVPGQVGTLQNFLVHNSTPTLSKQVGLLDRYSRYQAEELARRGAHFHWIDVTLRPVAIFLYRYFWQRGFTEGLRGLFVAFHAMAFSFFTHSKLWEREWRASQRR